IKGPKTAVIVSVRCWLLRADGFFLFAMRESPDMIVAGWECGSQDFCSAPDPETFRVRRVLVTAKGGHLLRGEEDPCDTA
ncbi:MAG: hypothetical protein WAO13_28960, partial [Pseudolabrys sp.]